MINIVLIISIGFMNILCFFIGAKIGQKVINKEEIKIPNPIEEIKNHKVRDEELKEQEIMRINLENIDNYTGDSIGQKEIPY